MSYTDFVKSKLQPFVPCGRRLNGSSINPKLFDFQQAIVRWACRMGRAAIFADCGLGKSFCQIEWARLMGETSLIFAPLTVAEQTIGEGAKLGVPIRYVADQSEIAAGINITNYDRFDRFRNAASMVDALVLDESSILKSVDGKTRSAMLSHYQSVPHRLCCTATPAPNDIAEIANHSAFLGIKTRPEMLATFFVHDADGWRLKRHAQGAFYEWLASWSVYLRKPSDLGYDDDGYDLPNLNIQQSVVECCVIPEGHLFPVKLSEGIVGRSKIRRETLADRVAETVRLVNAEPDRQWIVWCGLNDESDAVHRALPDSVQVEGRTSPENKIARLRSFLAGDARVLVTKPRVCGFGMNFQNASRQVFCGIGDSWEQYYQCVRRSWRFGQTEDVSIWIVTSDAEDTIVANVMRKEEDAKRMGDMIMENMGELERAALHEDRQAEVGKGVVDEASCESWRLINGDCVEVLHNVLESESVDFTVFSPPFATLYTYSDSPRDMGNSRDHDQFFEHFGYFCDGLFRVVKPGRLAALHVAQTSTTLNTDGRIGIRDFRGRTIEAMERSGWHYHGDFTVDKCPQAQAIRTHSKALLFVQLEKDRSWSRPALADYILLFRKPGENAVPINDEGLDRDTWIEWARPVWYGIRESDTLNVREARGEKDERHICPLQLGVIERCIRLWINPGELVLSPFAGIGSEGFESIRHGRRFVGVELKREYFETAKRNLSRAQHEARQPDLFAGVEEGV